MFILDRQSPEEAASGVFLDCPSYRSVLTSLFEFAGRPMEEFWFTPVVACPTTIIPVNNTGMPIEHVPLPKNKEVDACAIRIHEELYVIEPRIVVAFGPLAARVLIRKGTPSIHYNLGEVHEGTAFGVVTSYPMPVLLTHSLHTLLTQPDLSVNGPWHKVGSAISRAIEIADALEEAKWPV